MHTIYGPLEEFTRLRSYAPWNDSLGRRETWKETMTRYAAFADESLRRMKIKLREDEKAEFDEALQSILKKDTQPSMRLLWSAGRGCNWKDGHIGAYNCAFTACNRPDVFGEAVLILSSGTGLGYSVEREFIQALPAVQRPNGKSNHVVIDSKIGWKKSIDALARAFFYGADLPVFDYSLVRPKGTRLKTSGGFASGPEPLMELHRVMTQVLADAIGRQLRSLEVHYLMCMVGEVIQSGGSRRSALICVFDVDDTEMIEAKSKWNSDGTPGFPKQFFNSNNSAAYNERPSRETFKRMWDTMAQSGSGEPGLFNRSALLQHIPPVRANRLENSKTNVRAFGLNPCVPAGTKILTSEGYKAIDTLVGKEVEVWNGVEFSKVSPKVTGHDQPLVKVTLSDGTSLVCTEYHEWILADGARCKAIELEPGEPLAKFAMPVIEGGECVNYDPYTHGFFCGDGMEYNGKKVIQLYGEKKNLFHQLSTDGKCRVELDGERIRAVLHDSGNSYPSKTTVPINLTADGRLEWFGGLLDSDGTVIYHPNSASLQITSIDLDFLNEVRLLLTTLGVQAKVVSGKPEQDKMMPNGRGGQALYHCAESYRLLVNATDTAHLVRLGLRPRRLRIGDTLPNRDARRFVTVVSVEPAGQADTVYCFNEPKNHTGCFAGIVTGQCGEILLLGANMETGGPGGQFCNLSSVVLRPEDTPSAIERKVRLATIIGTYQSTLTYFPELSDGWTINTSTERLLGVSINGQMDVPHFWWQGKRTQDFLAGLRRIAHQTNREWAAKFGIPISSAITCVKPEGNGSVFLNCSSGMHGRNGKYQYRRVRILASDPLARLLVSEGVPNEPEYGRPDNLVFTFARTAPESTLLSRDISAKSSYRHYLDLKQFYCDHNASCSIYFDPSEADELGSLVYENLDNTIACAFFPRYDGKYPQQPEEEITKEQYAEFMAKFPEINWGRLAEYETHDATTGNQELACTSGSCSIN